MDGSLRPIEQTLFCMVLHQSSHFMEYAFLRGRPQHCSYAAFSLGALYHHMVQSEHSREQQQSDKLG
ncbi:hypothetical protein N7509_012173 [Penicillium cosmopolitanum]|uniref:Uncharacterized protein n=1 Tax=Penicillium cosmopolitanum TaxID=1131564 RepID=A0A9W9SKQ8_9EURO|nr:uncharacterized protein N7509_012173 [Penicillium cosmopolitanum]KAJ5379054.1 hypothetical protein N7509_012173 [Penicillium cosmopolitanum]